MIVPVLVIAPFSIVPAGILILIVAGYVAVRASYDLAVAVILTPVPIAVIPT